MRNSRSSWASSGSFEGDSRRRSSGVSMVSSKGYLGPGIVVNCTLSQSRPRYLLWVKLLDAAHDEIGQFDQRRGPRPQWRQSRDRAITQASGAISGGRQTDSTRKGRFAQCRNHTSALSKNHHNTHDVEDVILDLECETDLITK